MQNCCCNEWNTPQELPFWYSYELVLDYYDGQLEGITQCIICQQSYYYKLLSWDNNTQDCRVFAFYKIDINPQKIAELLNFIGSLGQYGGTVPVGKGEEVFSIIRANLVNSDITNICESDDHFHTGKWRRSES
jgi:hypothetical protein